MNYQSIPPKQPGLSQFFNIDLREIVPFIHWSFFFRAWRIPGKFEGIEKVSSCVSCEQSWLQNFSGPARDKAEEAIKLFQDAKNMLQQFSVEKSVQINAAVGLFSAFAQEEDIHILHENKEFILPTLRQQHPSTDSFCYALSDFLNVENDYIGTFATVVQGTEELIQHFEDEKDIYSSMMVKTLANRLAEATAEWLHYQVRTKIWGYAPDELLEIENILKNKYQGIRPAIGYPSLPDQSIIFDLEPLLQLNTIGIKITENGAMYPPPSVAGLYFAHPQSKYFNVGKIDDQQLKDYARRRGKTIEEMKKWLAANI